MTPPDSNWTAAVIVGVVTGLIGWWQKRQLAVKVKTHANEIASLKQSRDKHDLQISRLTPAAHEKHCSSTDQIAKGIAAQHHVHRQSK